MDKVENRFELVHLSAKRAKQLLKGSKPLVRSTNREVVTALREIADNFVYFEKKEIIEKLEKLEKKDIPYQLSNFAP